MGEPSGVSTGLAEKRSWGPSSRQARRHRALGCAAAVTHQTWAGLLQTHLGPQAVPPSEEGSGALVQPDTWGSGPALSAVGVQWPPCPGSLWYRPWSSGGHGSTGCWTLGLGAAGVYTPRVSTTVVWPQCLRAPLSPNFSSSTPSSCLCRAPGLARWPPSVLWVLSRVVAGTRSVRAPVCMYVPVHVCAGFCVSCVHVAHMGLPVHVSACPRGAACACGWVRVCVRVRERARRNARGGWAVRWGTGEARWAGAERGGAWRQRGFGLYLRGAGGGGKAGNRKARGGARRPTVAPAAAEAPAEQRGERRAGGACRPAPRGSGLAMEAPRGRGGLAALWCLGLLGGLVRVAGTHYRYLWRGCYPCHLGQAGYPVSASDRRPGGRGGLCAGGRDPL